jgi:hypothetical protein
MTPSSFREEVAAAEGDYVRLLTLVGKADAILTLVNNTEWGGSGCRRTPQQADAARVALQRLVWATHEDLRRLADRIANLKACLQQ